MIKTYIYGIPNGFDFYEKDAEFYEYFKGFYIASRRGRRLLVNRRDNGDTVYSYLHYGMKEIERQPLHSFFGMSIVLEDNQFCPNFKVLLEWFDYIFERLVNERHIINKDANGIFHYVIRRFDENATDVEWLKTNLPNILTQSGQTQLSRYDETFLDGRTGQVVSFNHSVSEDRLLSTFKKYRWISISSDITDNVEEDKRDLGIADCTETIELDFGELNEKLNELNQQLLPIAVDVSKGNADDLSRMSKEVEDISISITNYFPSITDKDESKGFRELNNKFDSLKSNIAKLLEKFPSGSVSPHPDTQYCFSCKQYKPLSSFHSANATKCVECEKKTKLVSQNKKCRKCGKEKSMDEFKSGTDVCKDCSTSQQQNSFTGIGKYVTSRNVIGLLSLFALIICYSVVIPQRCSEENHIANRQTGEAVDSIGNGDKGIVVRNELDGFINNMDFNGLYDYIADKEDAQDYKVYIKGSVFQYLWKIIDTLSSSPDGVQDDIKTFFIKNKDLLDFIGFDDKDKSKWEEIANDYKVLCGILAQESVTEADLQKGRGILDRHTDVFDREWRTTLEGKPKAAPAPAPAPNTSDNKKDATFVLTYTKASDGKPTTVNINKTKGVEAKLGTTVTIKCNDNDGKIQENGRNALTLLLNEEKAYTVKCRNGIIITVTAKKEKGRFNE